MNEFQEIDRLPEKITTVVAFGYYVVDTVSRIEPGLPGHGGLPCCAYYVHPELFKISATEIFNF
jgi:hypothetical protein